MRELTYTLLELERWSRKTCDFCSNLYGEDSKPVHQIRVRIKATGKWVSDNVVCENCEEKFLNNELPKCERCGRLQTKHDISFRTGKHICDCVRYNEDLEEKGLPETPYESQSTFYERQINTLQEEKDQLVEEVDTHLEALEIAEDWHKNQKQELLDRIKELEAENKRLKDLTPQELLDEIKRLKEEVEQLKEQNKQVAQVEIKSSKRPFLLFGKKS